MHKLIVANYKMNGDKSTYLSIVRKLNKVKVSDAKIILCPPFVYLPFFKIKKHLNLGVQDISNSVNNKSTSQISPKMLSEFGVKYVIIGHSERRAIYDTDIIVMEKVKVATDHDIIPIVCVGEEKKSHKIDILVDQVTSALSQIKGKSIIFAYEPIWAIGSGEVPTVSRINKAIKVIKDSANSLGFDVKVLYGGSVNGDNYKELLTSNADGFLCGGVSLKIDEFVEMIKGIDNE
ncbi:MAG: triose-phosphate isomerase [Clostridia bacterium]